MENKDLAVKKLQGLFWLVDSLFLTGDSLSGQKREYLTATGITIELIIDSILADLGAERIDE